MPDVYCNSARQKTKNLLVSPSTGGGAPYDFVLFPRTFTETVARDNAQLLFQSDEEVISDITLTADVGHTILNPYTFLPVATLKVVLQGGSIWVSFFAALNQWIVLRAPINTFVEVWTATPIVDLNNSTLIWTFVPLPGGPAASTLWTHAAGVFTSLAPFDVITNITLSTETEVILANNTDAQFSYTPQYAGSGVSLLPRIIGIQQSSRAASFFQSSQSSAPASFVAGDTLSILGNSIGTAQADLDRGAIIFEAVVT